jgi:PBSX family phage terminase large subunit
MMGNTRETLIQNVLQPLVELVGTRNAIINRGVGTLKLFGRECYLFGAGNIMAMRKLQGKGAVGAYCDEAPTYPEDVWQMLGTRSAADGIKILATMNPDSPMHWMKKKYLDRLQDVNGRSWHFTLDDNPFLSEKVKNELKAQYTGLWKKRYIEGLWVMAEGSVYDLPEELICIDDPPQSCDMYHVAVDYGITNPTHFLLFGHSNNVWYILKEWRWDSTAQMRQKTDAELSADLGKFLEWQGQKIIPETIDIDPSATSFIVQARQDYPSLDIVHAINPVIDGIRTVSTALANGNLKVNRAECPILLNEYAGYVWDSKAQLLGEDAPMKVDDHAMDPMRYGAMRIFRYS